MDIDQKHDNETGDDFIVAQIGHGELGIDFDPAGEVLLNKEAHLGTKSLGCPKVTC